MALKLSRAMFVDRRVLGSAQNVLQWADEIALFDPARFDATSA